MTRNKQYPEVALALIFFILISLLVLPNITSHASGEAVSVWLTTADGANNLKQQGGLTFINDTTGGSSVVDVTDAIRYQQMVGFGAALTDTSAYLIGTRMNATQRANVLNAIFSPTAGIGVNFVRIPMGSSDFTATPPTAPSNYSYDDNNGTADPNLTNFSINHDLAYIIPTLKQALTLNPSLKFMANPWSPPAWMKSNNSMFGKTAQGNGTLLANAYGPLAQYFVKFIQAYQSNGVPIFAVSPQNEPSAATTDYAGMVWDATGEGNFIKNNLGPALTSANLNTKILGYDNGWDTSFATGLANDQAVRNYLGGLAFHCYSGDPAVMNYFKSQYNLDSYETECSTGPGGIASGGAIRVSLQTTRNYGKAVELWNLALDPNGGPKMGTGCQGCTGLVTIDPNTGNYTLTQNYYQLGHMSKFIQQGATRIDSTDGGLNTSAFINPDNTRVLVVHNISGSANTFKVRWNMAESFTYTLPNDGIATFTWQGGPGGPTATPTSTPVIRPVLGINSGGGAAGIYLGDSYYSSGTLSGSSATIDTSGVSNPAPQAVYQTERWGPNTYTLPGMTPGQSYTVRLHFAELNWNGPGMRKFNVLINGTQVLTEFDIFAAAGTMNKAVVKQFTATANSSGQIIIQYVNGSVDNAKSSGIDIYTMAGGTPLPTNTPTATVKPTATSTTGPNTPTPTSTAVSYTLVKAINAGGGAIAPYSADTGFSAGNQFSDTSTAINTSGVSNPAPQGVYQSCRWNANFNYTISGLTAGSTYQVRLDWAELTFQAAGSRVFNVAINGSPVLTNFDVYASAGYKKALVRQYTAKADSSGQIVIAFTNGGHDNPFISGIEILH